MSTNSSRKPASFADTDGKSGRGGYNKLRTSTTTKPTWDIKRAQAYTVSGHDLSKYLEKEKQYAGMALMERLVHESGSSLERRSVKKVPKGQL